MQVSVDKVRLEEQARRKTNSKDAMLGQLGLLVDEADALVALLEAMPDDLIRGRPFDGAETIGELLMELVCLDRTVRLQNLSAFLSEGRPALQPDQVSVSTEEEMPPVGEILKRMGRGRKELMGVVHSVAETAWDREAELGDEVLTPLDYLARIVQHDALVLRRVAERIYESRPSGSPGLSRR